MAQPLIRRLGRLITPITGDSVSQTNSLTLFGRERADSLDAQRKPVIDIFIYTPVLPSGGEQFHVSLGLCRTQMLSPSRGVDPGAFSFRSGAVADLFWNPAALATAAYSGRQTVRGVQCDVWTISASKSSGDTVYIYKLSVFVAAPVCNCL